MAAPTKTQRFLDLIAYLVGRRTPATFEDIMERVPQYAEDWDPDDERAKASVRRKFERDKDELREMGIPIETVDYSINYGLEQTQGYVLKSRDFYLPYLRLVGDGPTPAGARAPGPVRVSSPTPAFELREDEARRAIHALDRLGDLPAFPFRREARSALRKLTFDLGDRLAASANDDADAEEDREGEEATRGSAASAVYWLAPPDAGEMRERVRALSDALRRRKEAAFRYYGIYRDESSDRRVHPWGLLFQHSHWYLIAWDLDREAPRVFRVGRMSGLEVNAKAPKTPDYEVPGDFDLADWTGRPSWALPGQEEEPLEVTVRFAFPRSLWAERSRHGELVERGGDGSQLRRFRVQDTGPFLRWLLTLRDEVVVERPSEVAEQLEALRERVRAVHADGN